MDRQLPLTRCESIIVQELEGEILLCDTTKNQVFCLNQTAAEVWKLCDGESEPKEIAGILSKKLKTKVSEEVVLFALNELSGQGLLTKKIITKDLLAGKNDAKL